jgi:hypothetical protein
MTSAYFSASGEPAIGALAARAIEVLVTHNEPVSRSDLACALGVSNAAAWDIAIALETLGYARLDNGHESVEATPQASDPVDASQLAQAFAAVAGPVSIPDRAAAATTPEGSA